MCEDNIVKYMRAKLNWIKHKRIVMNDYFILFVFNQLNYFLGRKV